MSRLLSSNLSMQAKRTIFAQKNVKNSLNSGQNSMHVQHEIEKICIPREPRDLWCADLFRGLAVTDNETGSFQTDFD